MVQLSGLAGVEARGNGSLQLLSFEPRVRAARRVRRGNECSVGVGDIAQDGALPAAKVEGSVLLYGAVDSTAELAALEGVFLRA